MPPRTVASTGIDFIPDTERHGRPRELFALWAAPNVNYLSLVLGGLLTTLLGLGLAQALVVTVLGTSSGRSSPCCRSAGRPPARPARW